MDDYVNLERQHGNFWERVFPAVLVTIIPIFYFVYFCSEIYSGRCGGWGGKTVKI